MAFVKSGMNSRFAHSLKGDDKALRLEARSSTLQSAPYYHPEKIELKNCGYANSALYRIVRYTVYFFTPT